MQSMVTSEVAPGLFQARIPVPFPLKFVNCYLLTVEDGWVLIDAGLRYPAAEAAWQRAFAELGLRPDAIRAIYLTHYHPDHFGMAGVMQQRSGAPVFMTAIEAETARIIWGDHQAVAGELADFFRLYGMPADTAESIQEQMVLVAAHTLPLPEVTALEEHWADHRGPLRRYRPLSYAGHTDGHLCLYEPERQIFIAGDHILPKITPNISRWPGSIPDPLGAYLQSLRELSALEVALVLPAHGPSFAAYRERIEEIQSHHAERLERMAGEAAAGRTAFEICDAVFQVASLTPHQTRFAMAETLAHLAFLTRRGRLAQEERGGRIVFADQKIA